MIAEPSRRRQTFAADSCWPFSGRARWIGGAEARARALQRLERERACEVRGRSEPAGADDPERGHRRHELRAVDERETLLARQPDRIEPDRPQRRGAVHQLAVHRRESFADEGKREVRERCEVAARADAAARRDERQDAAVEALQEELDGLHSRAREALGECVRAQEHRGTHDLVGIRLPHAARVAAQETELQLLRELLGDVRGDEAPEARVDAVRVLTAHPVDELARRGHPLARRVPERGRKRLRARPPTRPRGRDPRP